MLVFSLLFLALAAGFTIDIPGRKSECFRQWVDLPAKGEVTWNVLQGGKLDIDVSIKQEIGPNQTPLFEQTYIQDQGMPNTWTGHLLGRSNLIICW